VRGLTRSLVHSFTSSPRRQEITCGCLLMDDVVLRGIAKWPNVPAVFGWLSLNRRGQWLIKRELISNPGVTAFIGRNYEHDERGRWFFQNGPQRVFVALDYTPFIYRIVNPNRSPLALECHTGQHVEFINGGRLDETGTLLIETEYGIGIVHDRDLGRLFPYLVDASSSPLSEDKLMRLMDLLQRQRAAPLWLRFHEVNFKVEPILSRDVPQRFGFVSRPVQPVGEEECC
jgi:hypothetical protein